MRVIEESAPEGKTYSDRMMQALYDAIVSLLAENADRPRALKDTKYAAAMDAGINNDTTLNAYMNRLTSSRGPFLTTTAEDGTKLIEWRR
jgi:hypothetical protein